MFNSLCASEKAGVSWCIFLRHAMLFYLLLWVWWWLQNKKIYCLCFGFDSAYCPHLLPPFIQKLAVVPVCRPFPDSKLIAFPDTHVVWAINNFPLRCGVFPCTGGNSALSCNAGVQRRLFLIAQDQQSCLLCNTSWSLARSEPPV